MAGEYIFSNNCRRTYFLFFPVDRWKIFPILESEIIEAVSKVPNNS
jgi:hypothetical protein